MPYTSNIGLHIQTLLFSLPHSSVFHLDTCSTTDDRMTPSPPASSPKSSTSSRLSSSSISDLTFHDSHQHRSPFQSGLYPLQRFSSSSVDDLGAAGPSRLPNAPDVHVPSREHLGLSTDESIRPHPSSFSPQDLEEPVAGADHDAGSSPSPCTEPIPLKQKKKRTRTLTTPHQSAVLHALLAQSRFPTTAMREEVGRSIGLSARKVQVWFQNQRQKARKPRSQSTVPLNRPPQFGPFVSGSQSERVPLPGPSGSATPFQGDNPHNLLPRQTYTSEQLPGPAHQGGLPAPYQDTSQYSLPNLSGHPSSQHPSLGSQPYQYTGRGHTVDSGPPGTSRSLPPPFLSASSPLHGPQFESHATFPPDPHYRRHLTGSTTIRGSEPPIVLPPLRFDQPHGSQTLPRPPMLHAESHRGLDTPRSTPASAHSGSASSSSGSHFRSSFTLPPAPSRHAKSIPPPFTLQPRPQWGPSNPISALTPVIPPSTPASRRSRSPPAAQPQRHRTVSDPPRRLPPLSTLIEQERPQDQPLITQPWSQRNLPSTVGRGGRRFDPVRSVLREGEIVGGRPTESESGTATRQTRHAYGSTMNRRSVVTPSPPLNPDDGELHHLSDQARE